MPRTRELVIGRKGEVIDLSAPPNLQMCIASANVFACQISTGKDFQQINAREDGTSGRGSKREQGPA